MADAAQTQRPPARDTTIQVLASHGSTRSQKAARREHNTPPHQTPHQTRQARQAHRQEQKNI
eukprot:scaffold67628_cov31-Tisochrysis_lutea.AAC.1